MAKSEADARAWEQLSVPQMNLLQGDMHRSSASLVPDKTESWVCTLSQNSGISHLHGLLLGKGRQAACCKMTGRDRGITDRSISFLMITQFIFD